LNPEFTQLYQEGYQNYLSGEWSEAQALFRQCLTINPRDGPCKTLLSIIEESNGKAPEKWKGFRALMSK
jgi:hypothetical protein